MKIALAEEMRAIDRRAHEEYAVPPVALMQSAGEAVARAALALLNNNARGKKIAVVCGHGNNGGDGFVAARFLANAGAVVAVLMDAAADKLHGEAAEFFAPLPAMGLPVAAVEADNLPRFHSFDLIVDALLGTGISGEPKGVTALLINAINGSGVPILAVDIPSGVDSDTGKTPGAAINALQTVTFALPKPGLLMLPGALSAGKVIVAPIGIPAKLLSEDTLKLELTTHAWMRKMLPRRSQSRDANKSSWGRLLVVAGSAGMLGAAALTAMSAYRTGAGYVTLAVPESVLERAGNLAPEIILHALPETPEKTHGGRNAIDAAFELTGRNDAVAIGPGMGNNPALSLFIQGYVSRLNKRIVMDADALNALQSFPEHLLGREPETTVLTPHPAEMARLLDIRVEDIQNDRRGMAKRTAQRSGAVVLLKGARSLIAHGDGTTYFNRIGTTALATAGSGDVLTGIIGALLAQEMKASDAARAGAYLHAICGEIAEREIGNIGVTAGDLRDRIPQAYRAVFNDEDLDEL